jgi:hypothetical protein
MKFDHDMQYPDQSCSVLLTACRYVTAKYMNRYKEHFLLAQYYLKKAIYSINPPE